MYIHDNNSQTVNSLQLTGLSNHHKDRPMNVQGQTGTHHLFTLQNTNKLKATYVYLLWVCLSLCLLPVAHAQNSNTIQLDFGRFNSILVTLRPTVVGTV